jgi:hypothetical protein
MAQDPALDPVPVTPDPAGKPNEAPPEAVAGDPGLDASEVDISYWLDCLDDAERAEQDWRKRAREVVGIYRNEAKASGAKKGPVGPGPVTFNILYANTEVILPAVYAKPPEPVVRSRFTKATMPPMMPPPPMPPMGGIPPIPAGPAPTPSALPVGPPPAAGLTGAIDPAVSINPSAAGGIMPPPGAPAAPPMPPPTMMPPPL